MTFTKYACWPEDRVSTVMNTDAESVRNDVFLAVHIDHDLIMVDPGVRSGDLQWSTRRRWTLPAGEFLREFLSPERSQVYAAVRGEAGSGKSHFIRWLTLNMPYREDLMVLTIPRTGTTLRGVLEGIINILPEESAREYREALKVAGHASATRDQRRERLLSEIALSIRDLEPEPGSPKADAEAWLISGLPHLFNDPHYRSQLSRSGGIIDQLVDHISEAPQVYVRLEERRAFRSDDLPLTGVGILDLSREARPLLEFLLNYQEFAPLAVSIINRSLDTAIAGVLNFQGDRLIKLMVDVRRYLRREGKALVLLIEDFANLQGIDTALLQVLIEAPSQGLDGLCELRWAMAVTGGYYEKLPDTVKSRMDFLIDMDLPTEGELAVLGTDSVRAFAAHYLRAVRLDESQLTAWHEANTATSERLPVPNRCDGCDYRDECHATFGAADGVGLYPFNQEALDTMAERQDPGIRERFNPRRFIKGVLAEVLADVHRQQIVHGEFPDDLLLRVMGGSRLAPAIEDQLKRNNLVNFERQRAVLELWGTPGHPTRLQAGIYTAFALTPPRLPGEDNPVDKPTPPVETEIKGPSERIDFIVQAIREWARGGSMPERAAAALREYLYEALASYIDWDTVGLERKSFMVKVGTPNVPFRQKNIVFLRQETQEAISGVRLQLPLDAANVDELRRTAIALEALRQFQIQRAWNFPNAFEGLVAVGECLAQWSATLLKEFQRWSGGAEWDAVAAAVELLAVGAALGGRLLVARTATIDTDTLNALFDAWPEDLPEQTTKDWRTLYQNVRQRADDIRGVLRAWAFATKGGQTGAMIDPSKILPPLRRVLCDWNPTATTPDAANLRGPYQTLATLHERVRTQLPTAVSSEYSRRMAWLNEVRRYIDEKTSCVEVAKAAQQLRDTIAMQGLGVRPIVLNTFDEAVTAFKGGQLDAAIRAAERLREEQNPQAKLQRLSLGQAASAMPAATHFFRAADSLLSEAEAALKTSRAVLDAQIGEQLPRDIETIDRSLLEIENALQTAWGESC